MKLFLFVENEEPESSERFTTSDRTGSYLELITAFKTSLAAKRDEISAAKRRYEVGLEKLAFATESVNAMQVQRSHARRPSFCRTPTPYRDADEQTRPIPEGNNCR